MFELQISPPIFKIVWLSLQIFLKFQVRHRLADVHFLIVPYVLGPRLRPSMKLLIP